MAFGENWGDAYIEVHADTNALRREMKIAAKRAAQEFGTVFGGETDTVLGKEITELGRRIEGDLRKRGKTSGEGFADSLETAVLRKLRGFDNDIADAVISGDWSKAVSRFDSLDEAIVKINTRWRQMAQDAELSEEAITDIHLAFRKWEKSVRDSDAWSKMVSEAHRMNAAFDSQRTSIAKNREEWDSLGRLMERATREMERDFAKRASLHRDDTVTLRSWAREQVGAWRSVGDQVKLASNNFGKHFRAVKADQSDQISLWRRLTRSLRDYESGYSGLGRLAGSRNDFIHLIGVTAGGTERAVGRLLDKLLELPAVFANFASRVQANGGGISGTFATLGQSIQSGLQSLTSGDWITMLVKLLVAITSVGTGLVVLNVALGLVVTGLSGVLGAATALVSTLAFGLAGALLPLGPMLLAVVAGAGALITAFVGLDDATKKMFTPLKDTFEEISKQVRSQLFANLADQVQRVQGLLNNFVGPTLIYGAEALRQVIDYMIQAFERPEVQETMTGLAETLPRILFGLGRGFTDLLVGLLGFFEAIAPQVAGVTDNLAKSLETFAQWANSAEGQNSIREFFETASSAAGSLRDLIGAVAGALATLFSQANADGQTMIDRLTEIINKFTEWANSDEGRRAIADWLDRAKSLASSLGDFIERVGRVIDALDNEQNMASLNSLIEGFGYLFEGIGSIADVATDVGGVLTTVFKTAARGLDVIINAADDAYNAIKNLLGLNGNVSRMLGSIGSVAGRSAEGGMFGMGNTRGWASGNIAMNPQRRLIGEAGAEAVVPLHRNLSMVDPSVRELSAFAQGKLGNPGKSVQIMPGAVQVVTPATNPVIVASAVVDRIAQSVVS